jgi:amidase
MSTPNSGPKTDPAAAPARGPSDIVALSAIALGRAIHSRQLSCRDVMKAYLDQIERFNGDANAIVALREREELLREADDHDRLLGAGKSMGWMHGFPHAVKDLAATKGLRTTWGSVLLDSVPNFDELFVARIRRAGAILIGKSNASEFGLGSHTYNDVYGITRNAYDPSRTAGGSSGGAAAAVALRMVPVADGSDMMGSLRNPAAFNNVVGFRPSIGRVPAADRSPVARELSVEGPMARSVEDVAQLLAVMAGPDPGIPWGIAEDGQRFARPLGGDVRGRRLGWLGDLGGALAFEPGVLDLCRTALVPFAQLGCQVEETGLPVAPGDLWRCWLLLRQSVIATHLGPLYAEPDRRRRMKPEAQWEIAQGIQLRPEDVHAAVEKRIDYGRRLAALFERFDFLLAPAAQVFPFDAELRWPSQVGGREMDTYHRWMEVVVPASLAGWPAISVPAGFNSRGLPMGLQIIGPPRSDRAVLEVAHAYERETRWAERMPPPAVSAIPTG